MPTTAVTLRVFCGGMRARVSEIDPVEVWRGTTLVRIISGRTLILLVEHAELLASYVEPPPVKTVEARPPKLLPAPRSNGGPPSLVPFTPEEKTAKAVRRRARRKD